MRHLTQVQRNTNVLKRDYANLKRILDKETKTDNDDEYVDDEPLKFENIKYHTQENLINRLLSKRLKTN